MCSYNSVRGVPACASRPLLQQQLRDQLEFHGVVASDCGAVQTAFSKHHYKRCGVEALRGAWDGCSDYAVRLWHEGSMHHSKGV